jgi:hypothetical protein
MHETGSHAKQIGTPMTIQKKKPTLVLPLGYWHNPNA